MSTRQLYKNNIHITELDKYRVWDSLKVYICGRGSNFFLIVLKLRLVKNEIASLRIF